MDFHSLLILHPLSTMKLILIVLLSVFSMVKVTEEPKVIGPDQPIKAAVGDDVVLPCFLKPPINVTTRRVDWKRNERFVHVYRSMMDDLSLQDENFRSRTSLFHDEMAKGNISLKLTNVTEEDAGNYTCIVAKVNDQIISGSVHLIVVQSELICSRQPIIAVAGDDVILPCHLEPAADAASWRVEWTKPDLNPEHIHVHEDGQLLYEIQNPSYNHRTRLFVDELMNGNVSMKIFRVKLSDEGKYRCFIPSIQKEAFVQLIVDPMREGEESKGADNFPRRVSIAAVLCPLAFVGIGLFVLWWKCRETSQRRDGRESSSQNLEDLRARLSNVENTDSIT